eukprot:4408681-Prymnesium_polylepis.1
MRIVPRPSSSPARPDTGCTWPRRAQVDILQRGKDRIWPVHRGADSIRVRIQSVSSNSHSQRSGPWGSQGTRQRLRPIDTGQCCI